MGAEPAVFGAFYRRFEDEVLGYFLARGAKPEVAADLTAETFAATLPSRRWKRLAEQAGNTLEASCRDGRVVADARHRLAMPALVLTDDVVARIAALDSRPFALAGELGSDDGRVRVIDERDYERAATQLRLSDAVVRRREPGSDRDDIPRIPQLEHDLAAAAAQARAPSRGALAAAAGLAVVGVLAFLALDQDEAERAEPSSRAGTVAVVAESASEEGLRRAGNAWARRFGAAKPGACVEPISQPACERLICDSVRGPVEDCVPLPLRVQRSFRGARVRDLVIEGRRATVRFTNGEVVDFFDTSPRSGYWIVEAVGDRAGRGLFVRKRSRDEKLQLDGNAWARFFAASVSRDCIELMTQPACEQVACETNGGAPVEDCVTGDYQRSFRDATVSEVVVVKGRRAVARFSNGELVEFHYVVDAGGHWLAHRLGDAAGRGLL